MNPHTHPSISSVAWRYSRTAVALHWGLALLIAFIAALGWYMMSIEDEPGSGWYFNLHKSLGIVMASLVAVRIGWRSLTGRSPCRRRFRSGSASSLKPRNGCSTC